MSNVFPYYTCGFLNMNELFRALGRVCDPFVIGGVVRTALTSVTCGSKRDLDLAYRLKDHETFSSLQDVLRQVASQFSMTLSVDEHLGFFALSSSFGKFLQIEGMPARFSLDAYACDDPDIVPELTLQCVAYRPLTCSFIAREESDVAALLQKKLVLPVCPLDWQRWLKGGLCAGAAPYDRIFRLLALMAEGYSATPDVLSVIKDLAGSLYSDSNFEAAGVQFCEIYPEKALLICRSLDREPFRTLPPGLRHFFVPQ
jgi:hypothetical protein